MSALDMDSRCDNLVLDLAVLRLELVCASPEEAAAIHPLIEKLEARVEEIRAAYAQALQARAARLGTA